MNISRKITRSGKPERWGYAQFDRMQGRVVAIDFGAATSVRNLLELSKNLEFPELRQNIMDLTDLVAPKKDQ